MPEKTQKQLLHEVHQGLYGVEGTEDYGLVGDVREIKLEFKKLNGRVSRNSRLIFILIGAMGAAAILGGLDIAGIMNLFGG